MSIGCQPLTQAEQQRLLTFLDSPRDRLLLTLGIATGFRISELLSIKLVDLIDPANNLLKASITVTRRNMKGKVNSRSAPLGRATYSELEAFLKLSETIGNTWLFESQKGNKLSRCQAWRVITDTAKRAGIAGKLGTHCMRKSFSKKIYKLSDKDIVKTQKALGHKNINSTISYLSYAQTEIDELIIKGQEK